MRHLAKRVILSILCLLVIGGLVPSHRVHAATTNVICDGTPTPLIDALNAANVSPEDDTLVLAAPCNYPVSVVDNSTGGDNALPVILSAETSGTLTIIGSGARVTRASGVPAMRLLHLAPGANVTINRMTFSGGSATSGGSSRYGGAIDVGVGATLTMTDSRITSNTSIFGTIYAEQATITLNRTTLTANTAHYGGGVMILDGTLTVFDSTFSYNTVVSVGGAVYSTGGAAYIINSTVAGNSALSAGGLYSRNQIMTITHSTIAGNSATVSGGGVYNDDSSVSLFHTLSAENLAPTAPNFFGIYSSLGYNLLDNSAGATITGTTTGNLLDGATFPLNLTGLAENGGPTQTRALLPGSVAINAGDPAYDTNPYQDQRGPGYKRVQQGRIDIGAVELNPCPTFPATIPDADSDALIAAINCANLTPANDVINLTANSVYTLTHPNNTPSGGEANGLPILLNTATSGTLTINGNGATITRAATAVDFRFFTLNTGVSLTLNGVTFSSGRARYYGGAIDNRGGSVTTTLSTFTDNRSGVNGGAIHTFYGSLNLTTTTFSNNHATIGGGVAIQYATALAVTGSRFADNSAANSGGGLWSFLNAGVSFSNNTFVGNSAVLGGGLYNQAQVVSITGSTFANNTATADGGGIFNDSAQLTITNSTLTGNSAVRGGGLYNGDDPSNYPNQGDTTVRHSTFTSNSATGEGGGVFQDPANANPYQLIVNHTLIANNSAPTGPDYGGVLISQGYNLLSDSSGATITGTTTGNLLDAAAAPLNLGALADNGGPTQTVALLNGSVAINRGNVAIAAPPFADQRGLGYARVIGSQIDIGAFEARCPAFPATVMAGDVVGLIFAIDCATLYATNDVINLTASTYTFTVADNTSNFLRFGSPVSAGNALPVIENAATTGTLTLNGNGATLTRPDGAPDFRFLQMNAGSDLTLNNLIIDNGRVLSFGGGIVNAGGFLTTHNSTFTSNESSDMGGAIYSNVGTVNLNTTTFENNQSSTAGAVGTEGVAVTITGGVFLNNIAPGTGGAIYSSMAGAPYGASSLTITDSHFEGNGSSAGGVLYVNLRPVVTIANTRFVGNTAYDRGGVLYNDFSTITITNSTFAQNLAANSGGALYLEQGTTTITNSTLTQNTSKEGGAIMNWGNTLTLNHSTITGNSATVTGGGLRMVVIAYVTSANHSIIATNTAPASPDVLGTLTSQGYNVIGNTSGTTITGTTTGNLLDAAAAPLNLGALADNGGPTQTVALLNGSIAINAGDPAFVAPPTTDQRGTGFPRVNGGRIDIGAYEAVSTVPLTLQLTLQSRPPAPTTQHVVTVHVQLRPSGGGAAVWSGDATSNTSGQVLLSGLPTGTYTLWVKGTHALARTQAITLVAGANNATTALLLEGDTDDSNLINVTDFSLLATAFGKTTGQVGFNVQADFNGDGIVNVTDFSMLATNFTQSGVP